MENLKEIKTLISDLITTKPQNYNQRIQQQNIFKRYIKQLQTRYKYTAITTDFLYLILVENNQKITITEKNRVKRFINNCDILVPIYQSYYIRNIKGCIKDYLGRVTQYRII